MMSMFRAKTRICVDVYQQHGRQEGQKETQTQEGAEEWLDSGEMTDGVWENPGDD